MHSLHLLDFLQCVCSNVSSNRLPERRHIHTGCIYFFLGHCVLSNVCSKHLYKRKQSRTGCICLTFLQCAFSNGFSKCLYVGMHITEGCSKAPTRSGQPSPESCAPPSPPSYTSSSPAYPSLTLHMGRLCSMWATTMFSKVRASISRTLCFSTSISLQFGVVHGQVLLYVGHHQVLHMNLSCKHIHFHF